MGLDPGTDSALWAITDATGIRPEWLLPVLYHESGFNPAATNGSYHGIGQNSAADIQAYAGVGPDTYLTWSASQQLGSVVLGYFRAIVARYGPLRSGMRVYQGEFLPATLPTATSPGSVLATRGTAFYDQNPSLDPGHTGTITLGSLAQVVAAEAAKAPVQAAIAQAYAGRLDGPSDPVYGHDFGLSPLKAIALSAAILAGAWAAILYIEEGPRPFRRAIAMVTP